MKKYLLTLALLGGLGFVFNSSQTSKNPDPQGLCPCGSCCYTAQ